MDKYLIIKNGLVLTLDRKKQTGFYNIIVKNGKIFLIDYERKFNEKEFTAKNPGAKIIDASGKLVMPGFFNSRLISSYALCGLFFKNCNYENINSWLSLKLVDKFLSGAPGKAVYDDVMKIAFQRSLISGEVFVNENPVNAGKDFTLELSSKTDLIKQYFNFTTYSPEAVSEIAAHGFSAAYRADENINNYSLTSLRKILSASSSKLFVESSLSSKTIDSIKRIFGKQFISVLAEMELIGPNTIITNPLQTGKGETEILLRKNSAVCICPQDYVNLSDRKTDIDELMNSGLRIIIGTGYTGTSVLSELKTLAAMLPARDYSYEQLLQTAIINPSVVFGISNLTGSIEKNKSCDLIMFDINDLRSMLTIPEPASELVCEFVIKNLSVKDITDVIIKGEVLTGEGRNHFEYIEDAAAKAKTISEKLYSAGKLQEFREKYLMRGRVDKILVGTDEPDIAEPEIFIDMKETEEYTGEGEFTIIGAKEEEFLKERTHHSDDDNVRINLKEIKSLENELNLFDESEFEKKPGPDKVAKRDFRQRKISKKTEVTGKKEDVPDMFEKTAGTESASEKEKEVRKSNLKFGFGDEE